MCRVWKKETGSDVDPTFCGRDSSSGELGFVNPMRPSSARLSIGLLSNSALWTKVGQIPDLRPIREGLQKSLPKVYAGDTDGESAHMVQMVGSWWRTRDVNTDILGDVLSFVKPARISGQDVGRATVVDSFIQFRARIPRGVPNAEIQSVSFCILGQVM